jgi:hypothetical protein
VTERKKRRSSSPPRRPSTSFRSGMSGCSAGFVHVSCATTSSSESPSPTASSLPLLLHLRHDSGELELDCGY